MSECAGRVKETGLNQRIVELEKPLLTDCFFSGPYQRRKGGKIGAND